MGTFQIEKIILPYLRDELHERKSRDPLVVPHFALEWKGPGVSNGYGFGEWKTEQYFREQGFYAINNEFNLLSKKSKFDPYNQYIASLIGKTKIDSFQTNAQRLIQQGNSIENPDLFVFILNDYFFTEVKKEKRQTTRTSNSLYVSLKIITRSR
ncbi:hypothetical protein [Neobacillus bataviensis]|uniref:hypothetical protein n=1 Tax=Neobacillus bataviensis TaxID=220685 RepID=UPI001CBA8C57|nr:hypothetical protein [Neobacillus bataviensis]